MTEPMAVFPRLGEPWRIPVVVSAFEFEQSSSLTPDFSIRMRSHEPDRSHGYDGVAETFVFARSNIGAGVVGEWARRLPAKATVLEIGCGHGVPISQVLLEAGVVLHGVDASPLLITEFRGRFPGVATECNAAENSDFFGRTFDGVVAWGLMFLLAPDVQALVVQKVSRALRPGGTFLFTAPDQACEWLDVLTGRRSVSLGAGAYRRLLSAIGLAVVSEGRDDGENHYYVAAKDV